MKFGKQFAILVATAILCFGCASVQPGASQPPASVSIDNFNFSPEALEVPVNTIVTWTNKDDVPHTVTQKGENPAFDSGALDTDGKFSYTFKTPGTYEYYCKVHTHMTGTIVVK